MPRRRVTARSRRETLRSVWFVIGMTALMVSLLVAGTITLEHMLREDAAEAVAAQVEDPQAPLTPEQWQEVDYVAMGDSYSAGPGLPVQVDVPCRRSNGNYPSLLAAKFQVSTFTDVTCSGARTLDVTEEQARPDGTMVAPQIEALSRDTDLVTISIGGNDESVFNSLVTTCPQLALEDPDGAPCQAALAGDEDTLERQSDRLESRLAGIIRFIRQEAPQAQVVLIGYPAIFPLTGPCDALPFAAGDVPWAARVVDAVVDGMRAAAENVGVRFVDLREASAGHDVCSVDPWIAGASASDSGAAPWHPLPSGMKAMAQAVHRQLTGA